MRLSRLKWLLMLLAAVIFITGIVAGWQTRRVDDFALKNAGKGTEWLTYGHTYSEQRYSPLKQIDTTNVSRLGLAWSYEVGPGGGGCDSLTYSGGARGRLTPPGARAQRPLPAPLGGRLRRVCAVPSSW